ncbi:type II toxin-antitoxin system VapC family toxin [Paracraurococcus lichenis]|uniref:Type II toxin-antitoxin system VapC family toxin n=1 Tax=Paracraurococcus lichenis TaxID=3064888 RepID=A0ABT9DT49_9PROT|nr:type II toxin-antitoxin system VapC family toxin [Paracraurococcus sp. LOR1-02]MDO9707077.1 type II toxin-antitoxin system VapC family toxin [Paracraurococcus sp. LOR1-02]
MKLLLDTHVLLWWLMDDPRLGAATRGLIADPANEVWVSAGSLWEIVVKQRVGKLEGDIREIVAEVRRNGFRMLDIAPAHLAVLAGLPAHHRDPFDHLLIAQAIAEGAGFVTQDGRSGQYPVRVVGGGSALTPVIRERQSPSESQMLPTADRPTA